VANSTHGLEGSVAEVVAKLSEIAAGATLAAVIKAVQAELGNGRVRVSSDMHRATVTLENGKIATVRATSAKRTNSNAALTLRFKPPLDPSEFETLYFGGRDASGRAIVHKFKPQEIKGRRTLTLRYGAT
jgi:hypothetical protein